MTKSSALLISAASFAAERHRQQRRKDVEASPYINHPLAVAQVLADEGGVDDDQVLAAALLHDTVEDTETTVEEIAARFGEEVARIVAEVTDDKALPKMERKRLQIENAAKKSDQAKLVKLADKICNLRDLIERPPSDWPAKRRADYFHWAGKVANGLALVNEALDDTFDRVWSEGLAKIYASSDRTYSRCVISIDGQRLLVFSTHDFDGGSSHVTDMDGKLVTSWTPTFEGMPRHQVHETVRQMLSIDRKKSRR